MSGICSSFHGNIEEIPEIFVDNFEETGKKAYFLSHCHQDHIKGLLTNSFEMFLEESKTPIYMSEISAAIIENWRPEYKDYIIPLKLGSSLVTIKRDGEIPDLYLMVSLIPAGHCFGSVMFLFKTPTMTILYTGDFRISQSDITKYNQLHEGNEPINIDVMYVDTTFQDEKYKEFPKRSETVEYAINEIKKWLEEDKDDESRCVALSTSARFGYEYVFKEIYSRLGMKVYVQEEYWGLYSRFPDVWEAVTRNPNSRVHRCGDKIANKYHNYCEIDRYGKKFLHVALSAWSWKNCNLEEKMMDRYDDTLRVCFATHCSSNELRAFVSYFSPKKIVGFRDRFLIDLNEKRKCKDALVRTPTKKVVCEREGVKKASKEVLRRMFED